ncbi:hypothetical protein A4S06_01375 [Erysipelotrichaceae bacterium MTC7]|nr:hypothetical protein A4S06_01375 [Erysipelotrichaceae bacterium MTC7]
MRRIEKVKRFFTNVPTLCIKNETVEAKNTYKSIRLLHVLIGDHLYFLIDGKVDHLLYINENDKLTIDGTHENTCLQYFGRVIFVDDDLVVKQIQAKLLDGNAAVHTNQLISYKIFYLANATATWIIDQQVAYTYHFAAIA